MVYSYSIVSLLQFLQTFGNTSAFFLFLLSIWCYLIVKTEQTKKRSHICIIFNTLVTLYLVSYYYFLFYFWYQNLVFLKTLVFYKLFHSLQFFLWESVTITRWSLFWLVLQQQNYASMQITITRSFFCVK